MICIYNHIIVKLYIQTIHEQKSSTLLLTKKFKKLINLGRRGLRI